MKDLISVKINGAVYQVPKGTSLEDIFRNEKIVMKHPILIAKVNNELKELDYKIMKNKEIIPLDLSSKEGNRVLISGLVFVLYVAIKEIFGNNFDIVVDHSIDKGLYIETNFKINTEDILKIKNKMKEIINENRTIKRKIIDKMDAIKYHELNNDMSKKANLRYNTSSYIIMYKLGNYYNYFFTEMPMSTGVLGDFDLTYVDQNGLVLSFPTVYISDEVPVYHHHPNMFKVFKETKDWMKIMKLENSTDLNQLVSEGNIDQIIRICENKQNYEIMNIAKEIVSNENRKIVMMAGPSSCGKTTSSKRLCMALEALGKHPVVIAMDDYFVERDETPLDEEGNKDYESLEAVDLKLLDKQMKALVNGEKVLVPTYNFLTGSKEYKNEISLHDNDIILIEGIHALDSKILGNVKDDDVFKIYVSALNELNIDSHNRISTTDNRLLRRIIRDNKTRGYDVTRTLEAWSKVRSGEEKYIFPFQDAANYVLNTSLLYELGVLKTYVEPLLFSVSEDSIYYAEAKRLINFLKNFLPIPADAIPSDSVLREFIGGSCFKDE